MKRTGEEHGSNLVAENVSMGSVSEVGSGSSVSERILGSEQRAGAIGTDMTTAEFLDMFYRGAPQELCLVLWEKSTKHCYWYPVGETDRILEAVRRKPRDLYFGVSLQSKQRVIEKNGSAPNWTRTRGYKDTVGYVPGFWMDIDCLSGVHKETRLPTLQEAIEFLSSEMPWGRPSITVFSGGGLHAYWLFRDGWVIRDLNEAKEAQRRSADFQHAIISLAQGHGWRLDKTSDLVRILRLPGTFNCKEDTNHD